MVFHIPLPCRYCTLCPDLPERQRPSPCRARMLPCTSVTGEMSLVIVVIEQPVPCKTEVSMTGIWQEKQGTLIKSIIATLCNHCLFLITSRAITQFSPLMFSAASEASEVRLPEHSQCTPVCICHGTAITQGNASNTPKYHLIQGPEWIPHSRCYPVCY